MIHRWSVKRKVQLLVQIRREKKLVDVCREQDLKQSEVEGGWVRSRRPVSAASKR
jgi:hypothetical protein